VEYEPDINEPFRVPIEDVLDLHTVTSRDVIPVVEEYLSQVHRLGFPAVRIIHGRGIGVQREAVRKILARTRFVESFGDAPAEAGGWGATIVTLRVDPATIGPLCSERS
jgi:dsDNA-specific endonuclease/ATPase MutS2